MTAEWKIVYDALYRDGKKTAAQIQAVSSLRLTQAEKDEITSITG